MARKKTSTDMDTVVIEPPVMMEVREDVFSNMCTQLAAAKNLIVTQAHLLDCYRLHKPRPKAEQSMKVALEIWDTVNG